jgi:hypothetical protein
MKIQPQILKGMNETSTEILEGLSKGLPLLGIFLSIHGMPLWQNAELSFETTFGIRMSIEKGNPRFSVYL